MLQTIILLERMEKHFNGKLQCLIVFLFHIKANKASRKNKKKNEESNAMKGLPWKFPT